MLFLCNNYSKRCSKKIFEIVQKSTSREPGDIIGASLSEPHLDELAGAFLWYIYNCEWSEPPLSVELSEFSIYLYISYIKL